MNTSTTQNNSEQILALAPRKVLRPQVRNMIAVASGKGGVGKTWFSITLAHALAQSGLKTLLFDGDLGLANIDIQLGLMPTHDLGSVIAGKITLNQAICHYDDGNFDIIAGRSGSGSLANVPISRLQLINDDLRLLAGGYDRVIVDLGAGVEKPVRLFASGAASLMIVCTDEPTSLTDAYAFIKMICMEQQQPNISIIVNSANSYRLYDAAKGLSGIFAYFSAFGRRDPPRYARARRNPQPDVNFAPSPEYRSRRRRFGHCSPVKQRIKVRDEQSRYNVSNSGNDCSTCRIGGRFNNRRARTAAIAAGRNSPARRRHAARHTGGTARYYGHFARRRRNFLFSKITSYPEYRNACQPENSAAGNQKRLVIQDSFFRSSAKHQRSGASFAIGFGNTVRRDRIAREADNRPGFCPEIRARTNCRPDARIERRHAFARPDGRQ